MMTSDNTDNNAKDKKINIWTPLVIALAMSGGIFIGLKLQNEPLVKATPRKEIKPVSNQQALMQGRVDEIMRYVDAKYVDNVNDSVLMDHTINNLLQELDPHSVFIPSTQLQKINEELEGELDGIGIEAVYIDDTATVVTPIANSPAAAVGMRSGDQILVVDDSSAIGKNTRWLNDKLHGRIGTTVRLNVTNKDDNKRRLLTLQRDKIPVHAVETAYNINDHTTYIKITRFSANTTREFIQALENLYTNKTTGDKTPKPRDLIIDLRGNGGGYLDKAVDVLSQIFEEKDKLLVFTQGRTIHRNEYKSSGRQLFPVKKIAIIIDEGSASASEIVAGAIQDWDRGTIIGRRSFGKGLVQEPYILRDGSELRLTVARYFTPSGRSIQKPYKGKSKKEYSDEEEQRFAKGELTQTDSTLVLADTTVFHTMKGRAVYGAGGITPDIFVPIDPTEKSEYFFALKSWTTGFAYRYVTMHKSDLKFKNAEDFENNFRVTDYAFADFLHYVSVHDIQPSGNLPAVKEAVKKIIKARIARQLYGDDAYYKVLDENDACIQAAIEAVK